MSAALATLQACPMFASYKPSFISNAIANTNLRDISQTPILSDIVLSNP